MIGVNALGMPHGAMPPADAAESTVRFSDAYQRQHWCEGLGCWIPEHVVNAQAGPVLANGSRARA